MFKDRTDAGARLAERLGHLVDRDPVVVGLTRGGVAVAAVVAEHLAAPLEIAIVRKLGVPHRREVGFGAIGENGIIVLDDEVVRSARITEVESAVTERHERVVMEGQVRSFRSDRERVDLSGRTVIVVDDGIANGTSARAGCEVVRAAGASTVVLAVPVASARALELFVDRVDEMVSLLCPSNLGAVGSFYEDFSQVSDSTVIELLDAAERRRGGGVSVEH
jgi:predicted phosphoribosyltransferase